MADRQPVSSIERPVLGIATVSRAFDGRWPPASRGDRVLELTHRLLQHRPRQVAVVQVLGAALRHREQQPLGKGASRATL